MRGFLLSGAQTLDQSLKAQKTTMVDIESMNKFLRLLIDC